jgi:hypothetical protein
VAYTQPSSKLTKEKPPYSLFDWSVLLSLGLQIFLTIGSIFASNMWLEYSSWFVSNAGVVGDRLTDGVKCLVKKKYLFCFGFFF